MMAAELSRVATSSLVAAIWQGVLLAGGAGLGLRLLPKTPAAVRFAIWFGVFLVVAALPLIAVWPHAAGVVRPGHGAWLMLDERWSLAIAAVWLVASLVRAGTLVVAAFRVRALWARAVPVEVGGTSGLHPTHGGETAMDGAPGLLRRAQICTSDEVDRPTVIGFFSPKILIPTWLLEKLTPSELQQIVLHETGHLGRADDWMNLLQKIALVLFPLNPALAWVERRLCFERELAVDERVLGATDSPKAYAACLATLAEHRMNRRGIVLALGALGRESELSRRVGRILRRGEPMKPLHARLVLGGAVLGLAVVATGLERCPQVVGFAAPASGIAAIPTHGDETALNGAPGSGYKAVMWRPDSASRAFTAQTLVAKSPANRHNVSRVAGRGVSNRKGTSPGFRPGAASGAKAAFSGTNADFATKTAAIQAGDKDAGLDAVLRDPGTDVVQSVEVSSWESADGSRMVLTMVSRSTAVGRGRGSADQTQSNQPQPNSGHPYAAVPVRGGWLVFQL
ncbi:MAG TPA: M56 family metallopeptidase [Acidobacteriaceae bacterium]